MWCGLLKRVDIRICDDYCHSLLNDIVISIATSTHCYNLEQVRWKGMIDGQKTTFTSLYSVIIVTGLVPDFF
jgi:hypothetical protein